MHPLAYVVLELQIPFSPRMTTDETVSGLMNRLKHLPVLREEVRQAMSAVGDGGFEVRPVPGWRLMDRESSRSLILTQTSLTYEATRYGGFVSFAADVDEWLRALEDVCQPVGYDRLGLRYVNEVWPVESVSAFADWSHVMAPDYIDAVVSAQEAVTAAGLPARSTDHWRRALMGPELEPFDAHEDMFHCRLERAETKLFFALPDNTGMTVRLANSQGSGVIGNAPLKRYQLPPEPGPFFVVDLDGFWPAEGPDIRPFDRSAILEQMTHVHGPLTSTFQWATTHSYRDEAGVVAK